MELIMTNINNKAVLNHGNNFCDAANAYDIQ